MTIQSNFPAIKPSLNLDFANVEALDPRITFSRASTATYYGTQTALAEQNLLLQSQTFDNDAWAKNDVAVTANTIAAPDGTITADTIQTTISTASHSVQTVAGVSIVSGVTYTFSVFAKKNTNDFVQIAQFGSGNPLGTTRANFNISTGVVGTVSGGTSTITDVGSGWYRCTLTVTATANGVITVFLSLITSSTAIRFESWTAAGTESVYLWGAQVEQRSAVSAYTPTTTQPVTNYIPVLLTAEAGVPRFDHNPVTFESLGLEIEEQRTNLLLRSEEFESASWSRTASTVTANSVVSPDGTLDADTYVVNSGVNISGNTNLQNVRSAAVTVTTATTYTYSVYIKAAGYSVVRVIVSAQANLALGIADVIFNVSTGVITTTTTGSGTITPVGNGWYRCTVTGTTAGTTVYCGQAVADTGTANGYSGLFMWGAQLEAGAFATSYIPTVASQVTRSADIASMTGTNFSSWYNQGEGTFVTEVIANNGATAGIQVRRFLDIRNDASTEAIRFGRGAPALAVRFQLESGDVSQSLAGSNAVAFGTIVPNNPDIFAVGYSSTIPSLVLDGTKAIDITSGFVGLPTGMTQMNIGSSGVANLTDILNGTIKRVAFYPLRLTNTQLISLTS